MYQQFIDQFIQLESLPERYKQDIEQWFLPLTSDLEVLRHKAQPKPLLVGINGAQGTGKSTLAKLLVSLLQTRGLRAVHLSIDDFYLGKAHRQRLAEQVHPLLVNRGVPGTHDVKLLLQKLDQLAAAGATDKVRLPAFNKASDDCIVPESCPTVTGPIDITILEGWFIGAPVQEDAELTAPINSLEQEEDADGSWRRYVNQQLAGAYQQVFAQIDYLLMLLAPDFEQVYEWRGLQEDKLRDQSGSGAQSLMDTHQLERFIHHFERLTRHCLGRLPQLANTVYVLDKEHRVIRRADAVKKK